VAKPKVVFDTNVFVRALINPHGINARLLDSRQSFVLIASPAFIEEVTEVLARSDLLRAKAIREVDVERLIAVLRRARRVYPDVKVTASRDPDDNKFLEAALAGRADYVVTGDMDLRDLNQHEGVKILFPEEFLRELGATQ
jgi:putative PIN family toxin of toxin-antitoxin system